MSGFFSNSLDLITRPRTGGSSTTPQSPAGNIAGDPLKADSTINLDDIKSSASNNKGLTIAIAIVAIVGVIELIIAFVFLIRCCYRRRSRGSANRRKSQVGKGWEKVDGGERFVAEEDVPAMSHAAGKDEESPSYAGGSGMQYEPYRSHRGVTQI